MWAHLGMLPPSYECPDCGWQERVVLKATNKPLSVREVELIREAMDVKDDESGRLWQSICKDDSLNDILNIILIKN